MGFKSWIPFGTSLTVGAILIGIFGILNKNALEEPTRKLFSDLQCFQSYDNNVYDEYKEMKDLNDFPKDFVFGVATSSYQIEGAWNEDGKGRQIWDDFSQEKKGKNIMDKSNANVACDHYHKYKEDVKLMKDLGVQAYRFSISWARILPQGVGEINAKGVAFYSNLIDELIANGITPYVTLYHWDLPSALQKDNGWLNATIADSFGEYANVVFDAYGDRVKYWITLNEPWVTSVNGHTYGWFAPGIKSPKTGVYLSAHNQLRAHAMASKIYKSKYQAKQGGKIGITLNSDWGEPKCNSIEFHQAAERSMAWRLNWFADPIYLGDYPKVMRETLGRRLPEFTAEERKDLLASSDFFGLNHYTTFLSEPENVKPEDFTSDKRVLETFDPMWPQGESVWLRVVPWGLRKLLNHIKDRYNDPDIYVTENGVSVYHEPAMEDEEALQDDFRVEFYNGYLSELQNAIVKDDVKVKGYFAWSLLDNYEWADGYNSRFGLVRVNFTTQERFPKQSAIEYGKLSKRYATTLPVVGTDTDEPIEVEEDVTETERSGVNNKKNDKTRTKKTTKKSQN